MNKNELSDLKEGLNQWHLFCYMGYDDIKQRYKRTLLGPMWLVLNNIIFIFVMSVVMGALFEQNIKEYVPFVASGMASWSFITMVLSESTTIFLSAESIIKFRKIPLSIHLYRFIVRNFIIFLHNFGVILVLIAILNREIFNINFLYIIPGLIMLVLAAFWVGILFSFLGTRYRDVQPLLTSIITVLPFVTPIFWKRDFLNTRKWIADFNPLYHAVQIVREPLIGQVPPIVSYVVMMCLNIAGILFAFYIFRRYKNRIIFWL